MYIYIYIQCHDQAPNIFYPIIRKYQKGFNFKCFPYSRCIPSCNLINKYPKCKIIIIFAYPSCFIELIFRLIDNTNIRDIVRHYPY